MKELFKRKLALTEQGASDLIKSSVATFIMFNINMLPTIFLMLFLDQILLSHVRRDVVYYIASFLILALMYVALNVEYNSLYNATFRESENLRIDISRRLSQLPLSYFSKHDLSDLAQTIMKDVAGLEHALSHAIAKLIGFIGYYVVIAILLLSGNYVLGLCVILPIIVYFMILLVSKGLQVRGYTRYYNKLRANSDSFQEAIELQQDIKSFGMGQEILNKLLVEVEESEKIHIKSEFTSVVASAVSSLVLCLSQVFVMIIGTKMLISGDINILFLLGYLLASIKIKEGTEAIGMNMLELFYIDSMIKRINEIRAVQLQKGEDVELLNYNIELRNVAFSYDAHTSVINDVTFTARENEVTALVGRSGCGKTSILKLVTRLYDYDQGTIKISGKDIKEISTKSLFEKVSIVFQDVTLFNTSFLENIRFGKLEATDEEVIKAAKLANCDDFINKLPEGYNTMIGENGTSLSGGERQRLSIARAFLKNAPIIILDEIASSLDVDNEKKIQDSLNMLTKNRTVLIISHRLRSIMNADKIVVIDDGVVESVGKHEELIKNSKIYEELVNKTNLAEQFMY